MSIRNRGANPQRQMVGRKLKEARLKIGWTQDLLASELGVDKKTIVRWERGEFIPTLSIRNKIAFLLHTSAEDLGFNLLDEASRNLEGNGEGSPQFSKEQEGNEWLQEADANEHVDILSSPKLEVQEDEDRGDISSTQAKQVDEQRGVSTNTYVSSNFPENQRVQEPNVNESIKDYSTTNSQPRRQAGTGTLGEETRKNDHVSADFVKTISTFRLKIHFLKNWPYILMPKKVSIFIIMSVLIAVSTFPTLLLISTIRNAADMRLYHDALNNPNDPSTAKEGWPQDSYCTFASDGYHVHAERKQGPICIEQGQTFPANIAITAKMVLLGNHIGGYSGGILFNIQDDGMSYYLFEVGKGGNNAESRSGNYEVLIQRRGIQTALRGWTDNLAIRGGYDVVNELRVVIKKQGELSFFVNNIRLATIYDRTYASGKVGFFSNINNQGDGDAVYRDLAVDKVI